MIFKKEENYLQNILDVYGGKAMDKFNQLFLNILNEQLFHNENHLNITIEQFQQALKHNCIPIYDKLNLESKIQYVIDVPQRLVSLVNDFANSVTITKNELLNCFDKNWKFYKQLQQTNLLPIYAGKFDFNSEEEIDQFLESIIDVSDKKRIQFSIRNNSKIL